MIGWLTSTFRMAAIGASACGLVACGILTPTPARVVPPLPAREQMPDIVSGEVIDELKEAGFDCWFGPGGDIPPGWNCRRGDQSAGDFLDVGVAGEEDGPIDGVFVYRFREGQDGGVDPGTLDLDAASAFSEVVAYIVPDELLPTDEELFSGVQRNYPMELGNGWYLGFARNSLSRSLYIQYAADPR